MNVPMYGLSPAARRRSFSSGVSGQMPPEISIQAPHAKQGMCAQGAHAQRSASNPPNITNRMNAKCATTTSVARLP